MKPAEWAARHRSGPLDVVVTGLPSDAHTWNLVFIQLLLEDLGHKVVNLGPCVPEDEIVESCCKFQPDLLVVSSVNGHGFNDARPLIGAIRSRWELAGLPAVIGGKLGVGGAAADEHVEQAGELMAAGFDAVFQEGVGLAVFESFVGSLTGAASPALADPAPADSALASAGPAPRRTSRAGALTGKAKR
ncbi:cobalamin B12-binding domain-containing protein [Streptomyces sp. NBC_01615]|uniref:cobalamin B12-binding domain-containing protein n=1 Tax=Streptomyces sp. NBC_01615 TaxID=2975898 RepID=UPI0038632B78